MSRDGAADSDAKLDTKKSWRDAIDERLVHRCERHTRNGERLARPPRVRTWARVPKTHVDPADWGAGYLKAPEEREIPAQLHSDLRERSPQALLRDLYRPVRQNLWQHFEPIEGTARDPLGAMAELRQARMQSSAPPRIEPIVRMVIAYQRWRIAMMSERWEPMLADDQPRKRSIG